MLGAHNPFTVLTIMLEGEEQKPWTVSETKQKQNKDLRLATWYVLSSLYSTVSLLVLTDQLKANGVSIAMVQETRMAATTTTLVTRSIRCLAEPTTIVLTMILRLSRET